MGQRDRPSPLPDGATCTVCGAPVPTARIRLLARRDGLAFIQLACDDCGSPAIGLLLDGVGGEQILDVAMDPPSRIAAGPITREDVDAVRLDLAAWQGDLVGWLAR